MTPLEQHVERWRDCKRCDLWDGRTQVVFGRGDIPCDLLFVGEAPGKTEDATGEAFVGQVGRMLDEIIRQVLSYFEGTEFRIGFTNSVCCIPRDETKLKTRPPDDDECEACRPRLDEMVTLAEPKLVVAVGDVARRTLAKLKVSAPTVSIVHPGAIVKAPFAQQPVMRRSCVVAVRDAIRKHLVGGSRG